MSKKILSLALAVVMLFSVCAVAANAAVAEGKSIGLKVVSDAAVGAPAGTIVNVKVYYTIPDGEEVKLQAGPIAVAWNSAAYKPNTTSSNNTITDIRTFGESYVDVFKSTSGVSIGQSSTIISKQTNNPYNWNTGARCVLTMNNNNGYNTNTGFPVDPDCEIFTLSFVAQRTLTADDVIGIADGCYGDANFKINAKIEGSTSPSLFAIDTIDLSEAYAIPAAASYDVYKLADSRKHLADDNTYTTATFFAFKGLDLQFDEIGTSAFLTSITATVTASNASGSLTINADAIRFVYDLGSGEYGFRVICKGLPADADVTITPVLTTTDSATYDVESQTFNVADLTAY